MTVGERIKMLCDEYLVTQKDLANSIVCSEVSMSRWINNDRGMKASTLVRIARYFDVSTDYLLGLSDKRNYNGCVDCDEFMEYCEEAADTAMSLMEKMLHVDGEKDPQTIANQYQAYKYFEHEWCLWRHTMPSVIHSVADGSWKNERGE